jgi:hypothetical protein
MMLFKILAKLGTARNVTKAAENKNRAATLTIAAKCLPVVYSWRLMRYRER